MTGIRSWTAATSRFAVVVRMVQDSTVPPPALSMLHKGRRSLNVPVPDTLQLLTLQKLNSAAFVVYLYRMSFAHRVMSGGWWSVTRQTKGVRVADAYRTLPFRIKGSAHETKKNVC